MKLFQVVLTSRFSNEKPECSLGEISLVRFRQRVNSLDCLTLENGTIRLARNDDMLRDVQKLLPYRIHLT